MATALELRELTEDELETRLAEHRRELLNLRFQLATGQLDNPTRIVAVRKEIARVMTVLRALEIEAFEEAEHAGAPAPAPRRQHRPVTGRYTLPERETGVEEAPGDAADGAERETAWIGEDDEMHRAGGAVPDDVDTEDPLETDDSFGTEDGDNEEDA
jgi:large subunit ribosomal protein L29